MSILHLQKSYQQKEKIAMVTCYDYWSAKLLAETAIDALLVGDTLAMVVHGYPTTLHANMAMMKLHTAAVARGAGKKFIIADMPFLSYRSNLTQTMRAVAQLMQAGAHAVKLEGAEGNSETIQHIVTSGIPVMGHLGLTPQSIHQLGGFRVQGKNQAAAEKLKQEAMMLQQAGCFALVLECVPPQLAQEITAQLNIPTIGIGAGIHVSGQVLVLHDLLGLQPDFQAKFLKKYDDGSAHFITAINNYTHEVKTLNFPKPEHCY